MKTRAKRRDRYQSRFYDDLPQRGVQPAAYDLSAALVFIGDFVKEHGLSDEQVQVGWKPEETMTISAIVEIALDAYKSSVNDACWIYQRLQQNEEAARLMAEVSIFDKYEPIRDALTDTLNNRAIVSRGFVSGAKRIIAKREAEAVESDGEA